MIACAALPAHAQGDEFRVGLPIDCAMGTDCFVQSLVDIDEGPDRRDYQCSQATYDGHKGTDIRLRNIGALLKGVPVLSVAPGTVVRLRDGVADDLSLSGQYKTRSGQECGNGLIVDHGDGWESQYCHLKEGSVEAREGDKVTVGQPIGLVGMSGKTEFPHIHMTLRKDGKVVDPYSGLSPGDDCRSEKTSLWTKAAADVLSEPMFQLVDFAFTDRPVKPVDTERLRQDRWPLPERNGPALVAYLRVINLEPTDSQSVIITGPQGMIAEMPIEPQDRFKARYVAYVGKKTPRGGWPRGAYQATYKLEREGRILFERTIDIDL